MEPEKIVNVHWIGRLGNRMFQYAFGCSYAFKHGIIYYTPSEWEGSVLFKPFPYARPIPNGKFRDCVMHAHHTTDDDREQRISCVKDFLEKNIEFRDFNHNKAHDNANVAHDDLSMMFFADNMQLMCTEFLRKSVFAFSDLVKGTEMYQDLESRKSTYVVAHIRRGDIVSANYSGSHSAVTLDSYKRHLQTLGIKNEDVIWISEDTSIATKHKWYFPHGDMGWKYPEGQRYIDKHTIFDFLPDLLTIYFAKIVLRGNSGFSWWAAELSGSDVYSPVVPDRPEGVKGAHWVECEFVNNNTPHFMGARWDPILLRNQCTPEELKFLKLIKILEMPDCVTTPIVKKCKFTLIIVLFAIILIAVCTCLNIVGHHKPITPRSS